MWFCCLCRYEKSRVSLLVFQKVKVIEFNLRLALLKDLIGKSLRKILLIDKLSGLNSYI